MYQFDAFVYNTISHQWPFKTIESGEKNLKTKLLLNSNITVYSRV